MASVLGYAIYYRDKYGFEIPFTEYGEFLVFPNANRAEAEKDAYKETLQNMLHPKVIYKTTYKWFFKKVVTEVKPTPIQPHQRELWTQQFNTLFVRKVSVH